MVATLWGQDDLNPDVVTGATGDQVSPSIADSGGGSYGVAWTSSAGVTVRFYDGRTRKVNTSNRMTSAPSCGSCDGTPARPRLNGDHPSRRAMVLAQ